VIRISKPKIIILRGKPTAGKSAAFDSLRRDKRLQKVVFIDHVAIKRMFSNLGNDLRKSLGKEVLFYAMRKVMDLGKDIMIEEMSREAVEKHLKKEIKKHDYGIIVFQFDVSLPIAYKRNIQRSKALKHKLMKKEELDRMHKEHERILDKMGIMVDTDKLNERDTVEFIIKRI
jgi:predicted kinase